MIDSFTVEILDYFNVEAMLKADNDFGLQALETARKATTGNAVPKL